ncbi:MAG TPA: hypothetical protein VE441_17960 [Mycobacterium sp.]|jgi:hypothetical protein|nr:hypothetical protein [Mycobacterium sp.]
MRRSVFTLACVLALTLAGMTPAFATGPGGWDHVGVGSTSTTPSLQSGSSVTAMNTDNPGVLYVGGNFTSAGGNAKAKRIARWNGTSWSALGNGLPDGGVFAIAYDKQTDRVFAGGTFHDAGGNANADFLAVWDGATWAPFCTRMAGGPGPTFGGSVAALQIIGNTLYVGGAFQNGAGLDAADYLLACDLTTGDSSSTVLNDGDFTGAVYALTADSNGVLYAGGGFINLDQIPAADHVAAYDGAWHAMGGDNDVNTFVRSLTAHGPDVYVGTDAVNVAGIPQADHVVRWNGASWSAVGTNTATTDGWFPTTAFIYALADYGSIVVAAGSFQNANGTAAADSIAYFDGTRWRPVGSDGAGNGPFSGNGTALGIALGHVYLGGNFTSAGGDTLSRSIAAYALRLPDASIAATSGGSYVGNNVYSPTGAGEVRHVTVTRGKSVTSYVKIQNDGLMSASFKVKGAGGATGIRSHYYIGTTSITADVHAGTYATATITPRASIVIRVVVTVAKSSAASTTFTTTARSTAGTPPDAVRIAVNATS